MMTSKIGLEANDGKTEYIILSCQDREYQQGQTMNIEGQVLKRVTRFKYLGHLLTQDNDLKMEVSARRQKGNKSFFGHGNRKSIELKNIIDKPEGTNVHDPDTTHS